MHLRTCSITALVLLLHAAPAAFAAASPAPAADENYHLATRDHVEVTIFDEPDLSVTQRIDADGQIRLPLLGTIKIAGMSVRGAEDFIEEKYVSERILRRPMATVRVIDYAVKEVSVHGAVAAPGSLRFAAESSSMDVIEVIAKAGGFADRADGRNVRVTRSGPDGSTVVFTINVEAMIIGRLNASDRTLIYPGDIVFVPTRVW